jgi:hypothetical protein
MMVARRVGVISELGKAQELHMVDKTGDETRCEQGGSEQPSAKKPYQRPMLIRLGTLRDMTMTLFGGGAPDGRPSRGTKRGGDFETCKT